MLNQFEDDTQPFLGEATVRSSTCRSTAMQQFSKADNERHFLSTQKELSSRTWCLLQLLEYYGLPQHGMTKWQYLGVELLFLGMFSCLAWVALAFTKHGKR